MDSLKIGKKEIELKYTFNSFKYMEDFDLSSLADIENKPFKVFPVIEVLLLGALNNSPKVVVSRIEVADFVEEYAENGDIIELFQTLMKKLEESRFFKSLQKTK
jgi:hypothetical protein